MNSDEQTLIDGLFSRLQQAEKDSGPRDALAEQRIKDHVARQPNVAYFMAQAILVQEAALKRMDQQNKQLQQDLEQARALAQQPAQPQQSGGFLSSLFGGGSREPAPAPQSSGGWREPARAQPYNGQPQQPQQPYYPPQQQAPAAPSAAGSFMGGALKTAAGVAGGVMLAEGISSLFHHNAQPEEIVEVIKEEPNQYAGNNNDGAWGNNDQASVGNDSWANQDPGGFGNNDQGSDDGGGFFSDDDDYV